MHYKIFIICFLLITLVSVKAQNVKVIGDLRMRTSFEIEKEIIDDLNIFGEFELGLEQDLEKIGKIHGELGTAYTPWKFLSFEAKYRYTKNRKNYTDEYKYTHTFAIATEADYKFDRLKLYYRLQYQNVDDELIWTVGDQKTSNILRHRIKLKYNIKGIKINPFISSELYTPWGYEGLSTTKLKTISGIEYDLKKFGSLKVYYRNDHELTSFIPYTYHTWGISFNIKL